MIANDDTALIQHICGLMADGQEHSAADLGVVLGMGSHAVSELLREAVTLDLIHVVRFDAKNRRKVYRIGLGESLDIKERHWPNADAVVTAAMDAMVRGGRR